MKDSINITPINGSLRIHTRAMQQKTSSNQSFQDQMRLGLKNGIDLANNGLQKIASQIPGGAQLTASLSEAANNLSGIDMTNSDPTLLQNDMVKNNQEMLEQQMRVSQITTRYSTHSYILKAMFDSLKTIGSNIR